MTTIYAVAEFLARLREQQRLDSLFEDMTYIFDMLFEKEIFPTASDCAKLCEGAPSSNGRRRLRILLFVRFETSRAG